MADGEKLNGSVDLLAKAMRQVFQEAVEGAVEPIATQVKALRCEVGDLKGNLDGLKEDVDGLKSNMGELKEDVSRLDTDMQNGFAELRPPEPDATRSSRDT